MGSVMKPTASSRSKVQPKNRVYLNTAASAWNAETSCAPVLVAALWLGLSSISIAAFSDDNTSSPSSAIAIWDASIKINLSPHA